MPWTPPYTQWEEGDIVAALDLNAIEENLQTLKSPPFALVNLNEAANYVSSSTTFVDVSAARLALTLVTSGGDVLVTFTGSVTLSAVNAAAFFDLLVDGVRVAGDDGIFLVTASSSTTQNASFTYWLTGLVAGAHTIKLQWRVNAGSVTLWAGAGTASADMHPQFAAREVS